MRGRFGNILLTAVIFLGVTLIGVNAQDLEHVVQKGETLFGIAKTNGLILQEILDSNHLGANATIKVGQKLILPGKGKVETVKPTEGKTPDFDKYTVQKGDTLYGLARQTGLALKAFLKINQLTEKSVLHFGQVVLVPHKLETGTTPNYSPLPSPSATPSPSASQSVDMKENTDQASEGTLLKTKPYVGKANLTWPHPGERLLVDGKLPGLLIKAVKGDPIKSVNTGKVVYSGPHSTLGHIVFIQSANGFMYIYGGNDGSALRTGDSVKIGDVIGLVGATPGFAEPEVYFSTWKDGSYIDPSEVPRD